MMGSDRRIRYVLLCEDRLQERFFREVAKRLQMTPLRIVLKSRGAVGARQAVERDYPREVQALRSKRYQKYRGLVAVVDGDEVGFEGRRRVMESSLGEAGLEPRSKEDRVALEIPTWSIETWLGALNGEADVNEATRYKYAAWLPEEPEPTAYENDPFRSGSLRGIVGFQRVDPPTACAHGRLGRVSPSSGAMKEPPERRGPVGPRRSRSSLVDARRA